MEKDKGKDVSKTYDELEAEDLEDILEDGFEPLDDFEDIKTKLSISEFDVDDDLTELEDLNDTDISGADVSDTFDDLNELNDGDLVSEAPVASEKKKSSSIATILGVLGIVGIAGGGAYFSGILGGNGGSSSGSLSYQAELANLDGFASEPLVSDLGLTVDGEFTETEISENTADVFQTDSVENIDETISLFDESDVQENIETELEIEAEVEAEDDQGFADLSFEDDGVFQDTMPDTDATSGFDALASIDQMEASVVGSFESGADIDAIKGDVVGLKDGLKNLEMSVTQQIAQLEDTIMSSTSGAPESEVSFSDIAQIKNSVDRVLSRLDSLEKELESVRSQSVKNTSAAAVTERKAPEVIKPAAVSAPAETPKPARAPVPAASPWQIRAIQVGEAVIARANGSETRTINIGDSVPGLGTVNDINYKDGGWVIEGSRGSIKQ